ncbi:hypothetical protein HCZ30_11865 [Marivivens donghaensis]|uniref:Uncharacterized protein n=1 Tax=Marivivens donghaensis TaxID=1699413 RepID=A0ABX0W0U1_9RHOB|nr:hypothetical protein [Marivivens donghaensis]NIY73126.1 hypothetical protein [Marivivens donghaensis]
MQVLYLQIHLDWSKPILQASATHGTSPVGLAGILAGFLRETAALLIMAVAAFVASVAAENGSPSGRYWAIAAWVASVMFVIIMAWQASALLNPDAFGPRLHHLLKVMARAEEYCRALALALLLLASTSMICISQPYRIGANILVATIFGAMVLYTYFFFRTSLDLAMIIFAVPQIILLTLLAIVTVDPHRRDEPHLTIGVALMLMAGLGADAIGMAAMHSSQLPSGYTVVTHHFAQQAFALLAFFAGWSLQSARYKHDSKLWLHAIALSVAILLWAYPIFTSGASDAVVAADGAPEFGAPSNLYYNLGLCGLIAFILWGLALPFTGSRAVR